MRVLVYILFLLAVTISVVAASGVQSPLRVVTLNTVLTEIATEVGGSEVQVKGLIQPGVDPHDFEPTPREMIALDSADLVFASGLGLESYIDRLVATAGSRGRLVLVGDALPVRPDARHALGSPARSEPDPHWWQSIQLVAAATRVVRDAYIKARPTAAADFTARAAAYEEKLTRLQAWVEAELAPLPVERRKLVTSHDAFGYLARENKFEVFPISGFSSDAEPDAKEIARLVNIVRREKIRSIFAESTVNPRLVRVVAQETGARLGAPLYGDGLSPPDGLTYEAMYRHNIRALVDGLLEPPSAAR